MLLGLLSITKTKDNLKKRIHAFQTLLKYKQVQNIEKWIDSAWETMEENIIELNHVYYISSTTEQKYMQQLEQTFL